MSPSKIPAAQYLRMSTEHQRYSLAAQAQAIAEYAGKNGFHIVRTYFDPGESGVTFENRLGLQALLRASLDRPLAFEAILVLDVSRWGRFQDIDQAAHYEFVCRSAGVRVLYCAEPFQDDNSPVNSLLKTLKRIMAAEFSRELSARTKRARLLQAKLGFFQGGVPGYGVRRVVVDATGRTRTQLEAGFRKAFAEDRVVLQPGPPNELATIRHIFRRYVRDERGPTSIARELNQRGTPAVDGGAWSEARVQRVLRNELAIGIYVTNTRTRILGSKERPLPPDEWVRTRVFAPIVRPAEFRKAQTRLGLRMRERPCKAEMLRALRGLLRDEGRLNARLINRSRDTPCSQSYRKYFGSLNRAYETIGYMPPRPKWGRLLPRREAILDALRSAHERHGYLTGKVIDADPALPIIQTYRKHFGSLPRAYRLAGLPHEMSELLSAGHARSRLKRGLSSATSQAPPRLT